MGQWLTALALLAGATPCFAQGGWTPYPLRPVRMQQTLLPSGRDLCTQMGVEPEGECDEDVILQRTATMRDPGLWFERMEDVRGATPPRFCLQPIAIHAVVTAEGAGTIFACHAPPTVVPLDDTDVARLKAIAARLETGQHRTLAEQRWVLQLKQVLAAAPR